MVIFYLAKYPKIQEKLRKEVNETFKQDDDITYEKLKTMEYLEWILLETTRHYGPAANIFLRRAEKDHILIDIPIIKGTYVNIMNLPNHYNKRYF